MPKILLKLSDDESQYLNILKATKGFKTKVEALMSILQERMEEEKEADDRDLQIRADAEHADYVNSRDVP